VAEKRPIEEQIRVFMKKHFPLAHKKGIDRSDNWLDTGILDSLGILDLVHFLEEEFSIQIGDDELTPENFQSLELLTAFVNSKIGHSTTVSANEAQQRSHFKGMQ
jgi:acyl carrier protein